MSVSIYDGTNDHLDKIAGREDTSFWEGTQAQWDALSSSEKAEWTGKYVIITDDEDSEVVNTITMTSSTTYAEAMKALLANNTIYLDGNKYHYFIIWESASDTYKYELKHYSTNSTNKYVHFAYNMQFKGANGAYQYSRIGMGLCYPNGIEEGYWCNIAETYLTTGSNVTPAINIIDSSNSVIGAGKMTLYREKFN